MASSRCVITPLCFLASVNSLMEFQAFHILTYICVRQPRYMSSLCEWPSLPHKFKGNKSMKIHIHTICAISERPILFNLIKLLKNEKAKKKKKIRIKYWQNMTNGSLFFLNPELWHSRCEQFAKTSDRIVLL